MNWTTFLNLETNKPYYKNLMLFLENEEKSKSQNFSELSPKEVMEIKKEIENEEVKTTKKKSKENKKEE